MSDSGVCEIQHRGVRGSLWLSAFQAGPLAVSSPAEDKDDLPRPFFIKALTSSIRVKTFISQSGSRKRDTHNQAGTVGRIIVLDVKRFHSPDWACIE